MNLSKRYKVLETYDKIYFDISLEDLRRKLDALFSKTVSEDDMTGVLGKYLKNKKLYRIKYIYSRNAQLQPRTYERHYILASAGEDSKGTYLEYVFVYDRYFEPTVRLAYCLTAALVIACMIYLMYNDKLDIISCVVLSSVALFTVLVTFKKPKENIEECKKSAEILKNTVLSFNNA